MTKKDDDVLEKNYRTITALEQWLSDSFLFDDFLSVGDWRFWCINRFFLQLADDVFSQFGYLHNLPDGKP